MKKMNSNQNKMRILTVGMGWYLKITVIFILVLATLICPGVSFSHSSSNGEYSYAKSKDKVIGKETFTITYEYGINSYVKANGSLPITCTITNKGEDFKGVLRVGVSADYYQKQTAYEKDVSIPSGGTKIVNVIPEYQAWAGNFNVQLISESDDVKYQEQVSVGAEDFTNSILIGTLSESPSDLAYFEGYDINSFESKVVPLDETTFPDNNTVLEQLSVIIISNFDTSKLSAKQYDALKKWIEQGGTLCIGLGNTYNKTLSIFKDDYYTGSITSVDKMDLHYTGDAATFVVSTDVATFELEQDAAMNSLLSGADATELKKGFGRIITVGVDFADSEILKWDEKNVFAGSFLLSLDEGGQLYSTMSDITQNGYNDVSQGIEPPNFLFYGVLFLLYAVFIGPVLYLILKGKHKRNRLWISILVSAAGCLCIVFVASFSTRVKNTIFSTHTFANESESVVDKKVNFSVQAPNAKDIKVNFNDSISHVIINDTSYLDNEKKAFDYDYIVHENADETCEVTAKNRIVFQQMMGSFNIKEKNDKKMECNLTNDMGKIAGTVTNVSSKELKYVVIYYQGRYYEKDILKPGETFTVKDSDSSKRYESYDEEQFISSSLRPSYVTQNKDYINIVASRNIYQRFYDEVLAQSMSNQIYVFAIDDNDNSKYIQNKDYEEINRSVRYQCIEGTYGDPNLKVYINVRNSYGDGPGEGNYEDAYYNEDYSKYYGYGFQNMTETYYFDPSMSINNFIVTYEYDKDVDVEVYNYKTEDFDAMEPVNGYLFSTDDISPYMNEGMMKIRYIYEGSGTKDKILLPNWNMLGGAN